MKKKTKQTESQNPGISELLDSLGNIKCKIEKLHDNITSLEERNEINFRFYN